MVKFVTTTTEDGELRIGLGLSRGNVERLMGGEPILVRLEELGLPPGSIKIFFGETEQAMVEELSPHIGPETTVVVSPRDLESGGR